MSCKGCDACCALGADGKAARVDASEDEL